MTFEDTVLRQAFHHFDKSNDNKISRDELREALDKLGMPTNSLQLKLMVKAVMMELSASRSSRALPIFSDQMKKGNNKQSTSLFCSIQRFNTLCSNPRTKRLHSSLGSSHR
jgi:hypothetical protein